MPARKGGLKRRRPDYAKKVERDMGPTAYHMALSQDTAEHVRQYGVSSKRRRGTY